MTADGDFTVLSLTDSSFRARRGKGNESRSASQGNQVKSRIKLNHPLFDKLRRVDAEAANLFPSDGDRAFGALGLTLMPKLELNLHDWCTPLSCYAFATTGGNGVHFSFLAQENRIGEVSPIVVTNPGSGMGQSHVVGENLFDFLCLGAIRGFFALEQLQYNLDLTLEVFTNPNWLPTEDWHYAVGYSLNDHSQRLLDFLNQQFRLHPWSDSGRFHQLQERYRLELPPN